MSMACRTCGALARPVLQYRVLRREVGLFECSSCSYVQTEEPTWLEEAYSSAINVCDTGIMARNQSNVTIVLATLRVMGLLHGRVVDCAGGYGILVRMLRDAGVDAYRSDPYASNLLARGFEFAGEAADIVTAFEAFEHFVNPQEELEHFFSIAPNLLISTNLIPAPTPHPDDWWYYVPDTGQHIGFFRVPTLLWLAKRFNKHLTTDGFSYHLFSERPVSSVQWKWCRRLSRLSPRFATYGLRSKTQEDFELLSRGE